MALKINSTSIKINGIESKINSKTIERNGILYLPFSEIQNVYNANVKYVSDTDTVIIDTNDRDKKIAKINTNSTLKSRGRNLSRTIEKLKREKT